MTTPIETPPDVQTAVDKILEANLADIKAMSLVERVWHMQTELGRIAKQGRNVTQQYNYLRESDLVASINELATKYRVLIIFRQKVEKTEMTAVTSANNKAMTGTSVIEKYDIINIDDPKERLSVVLDEELLSQGYSADTGDKSLYKAKTGAKKYALTDTFMVASGDDAEKDGAADERENTGPGRGAARSDGGPATEDQVKLWGTRQKEWGIKPSVAIGSIGKAINRSLNLKPSAVKDFLRSLSKRDMDRALAELVKVKPLPPATPPTATAAPVTPPATDAPPPRVPSAS